MEAVNLPFPKSGHAVTDMSQLLEMLVEQMSDGAVVLNREGCLLKINHQAVEMHGYSMHDAESLIGKPLNYVNVIHSETEDLPLPQWPQNRLLNKEAFSKVTYRIVPYDGADEFSVSCTAIPHLDEAGNFVGGILLFSDYSKTGDTISNQKEKINYNNELENYRQQLKNDRELLQTIIDSIPVMITIYDKKVESIVLNKAITQLTGWDNNDFSEGNVMQLVYPDEAYRKEVMQFMESLQPGFKDILMRTKAGHDLETSWANIRIPDGRQVGVGIDISQRKKIEKELIASKEKAEQEARFQHDFIQNISHEVRTPMNSILGFAELLQNLIAGEKESEFLKAITYNGEQLLRLIDDIIVLTQLDNNELVIQKEKTEIRTVIEQIMIKTEGLQKRYNRNHLKLLLRCPEEEKHVIIETDVVRLQQVLMNITDNALKYTEKGNIEIGYTIRQDKKDVLFHIKDTGIGIHPKNHPYVFRRFHRLHHHTDHEYRGTGLGLALSRQLVNLLGGEIWFESEPGLGSVFYFSHPFSGFVEHDVQLTSVNKTENIALEIPDLKNRTILIVEDDSFSYMMMYHMLEETHAMVLHADTGMKAIQIFERFQPDLVFLDIRLPEMDGYHVIEQLKAMNSRVPVVAQTANALPNDQIKIKAAGFSWHVTKPVTQAGLFYILKKFLK